MEDQAIYGLLYVAVMVVGVVVGALMTRQSAKEAIAEVKADKERLNEWTGHLASSIPGAALDTVNQLAQNAQEISRFVLAAQFPGVPFTTQLKGIAEIALGAADIVEDVTDKVQEPIAPFAGKGVPVERNG